MRDNIMAQEKEFKFEIGNGLEALPERTYKKGSKYDAIIQGATEAKGKYIPVKVSDKDAWYVSIQIKKRIKALGTKGIGVTVQNGVCYLVKDVAAAYKPKSK